MFLSSEASSTRISSTCAINGPIGHYDQVHDFTAQGAPSEHACR